MLKRLKLKLVEGVHDIMKDPDNKISDIGKGTYGIKVKKYLLDENGIEYETNGDYGRFSRIGNANNKYSIGDVIHIASPTRDKDGYSAGDVEITITKEEFLSILLESFGLPNLQAAGVDINPFKNIIKRSGYSKDGIPSNLDIRKSLERAISRRIVTKAKGKKPSYLIPEDLQYKYFKPVPELIKKVVIFFTMDRSGSMRTEYRALAKNFFYLFYLFLDQTYDAVTIRYITFTETTIESTEKDFFHKDYTGGTNILQMLKFLKKTITRDYDQSTINIYVSLASDGYIDQEDGRNSSVYLVTHLLPLVRHFSYVEVGEALRSYDDDKLISCFKNINSEKFGQSCIKQESDIFKAFKEIFGEPDSQ